MTMLNKIFLMNSLKENSYLSTIIHIFSSLYKEEESQFHIYFIKRAELAPWVQVKLV
jgi:hypothetical protein